MTRCTVSGEVPANPDDAPVPNSATRPDGQHVDHWTMCPGEIIKAGSTEWRQLPHQCPPGAAKAWLERIIDRSPREPFFKRIGK